MIRYQNRWAVVTGASSGLGRGIAARLASRGMSLVLTGRNEARLRETADQIGVAAPASKVELVVADLSTKAGIAAVIGHIGGRPIEVLVNNAGFGSYGPFADADSVREAEEIAVDVAAVVALARALLPGMVARHSGGILNVASTISFQAAPYQAVYGASKAFVLSFSEALWAEARAHGVSVTALCPGPTRTGFVDALRADVGHTAIYKHLADPEPVIEAGLRALDKGRAVVVPGWKNTFLAVSGRFMPRQWLTLFTAWLLGAGGAVSRAPIEVQNELLVRAPAERVWEVLTDVEAWPSWYRACRWVRREESSGGREVFRWKAHPVTLRSTVLASERGRSFSFLSEAGGLRAVRTFTLQASPDGASTLVIAHESQRGPFPWLGRAFLGPRLNAVDQTWLVDLAKACEERAATRAIPEPRAGNGIPARTLT